MRSCWLKPNTAIRGGPRSSKLSSTEFFTMAIGLLTLHLNIPACDSLKDKRRQIKPLISRLQREFNISVAELGYQDKWSEALIGCTYLSNEGKHTQRSLQKIITWVENHYPQFYIIQEKIELF